MNKLMQSLTILMLIMCFSCKSLSNSRGVDLSGNWKIIITYTSGDQKWFPVGYKDMKKFHLEGKQGHYTIDNYGFDYSANPAYVFKEGHVTLEDERFYGMIEGLNKGMEIKVELNGILLDNGSAVEGSATISYSFKGNEFAGAGDFFITRNSSPSSAPLYEAVMAGDLEKVKTLFASGEDIDAIYFHYNSLLLISLKFGTEEIAAFLIDSGADFTVENTTGELPLFHCIKYNKPVVLEALIRNNVDLNQVTREGWNSIILAAVYDHVNILEILLENGVDINSSSEGKGLTALMVAIINDNHESLNYLLEQGADTEKANKEGWTALMLAAAGNKITIVNILLSCGAEVNTRNIQNVTPLHLAVYYGHVELVELLLSSGADKDVKDVMGKTPLDYAYERQWDNIIFLLEEE
jgi:ankyrin repeat protein